MLRERPFNLKGGNNLIQSFCHITQCWILEKKFALCATKKINILTLVLSEIFWTKQKTITPLPPFKLNGRSLTVFFSVFLRDLESKDQRCTKCDQYERTLAKLKKENQELQDRYNILHTILISLTEMFFFHFSGFF